MATPLAAVITQIATDIEALTPPSDTDQTYFHVGDTDKNLKRIESGQASGHRGFAFMNAERDEGIMQDGANLLVEWTADVVLSLSPKDGDYVDRFAAALNEGNLIMQAIDRRTAWPTGVASVTTEEMVPETEDATDWIVTMSFRVTCWESD